VKRLAASLSLLASCASLSACGGATAPPAALVKDDAAARAEFAKAIAPLYDFSPCARWTPASLEARAIALMDRERALIARIDANPALKPVADEIRAHIPVEGRDITATECENPNPPPYPRPEAIRERAAEIDEHAAAIDAAERAYAAYQPKARA
jgi:hypothetical protein